MTHVGFTGTQRGMTRTQRFHVEEMILQMLVGSAHHGDCVGADAQFHDIVRRAGWFVVGHPPIDPKKRAYCAFDEVRDPLDYLVRNEAIVDASDIVIATPAQDAEQVRGSGTWWTVRCTRRHQRARMRVDRTLLLHIVFPDGSIVTTSEA